MLSINAFYILYIVNHAVLPLVYPLLYSFAILMFTCTLGAGAFTRDNMEGHPAHLYQEHLEAVLKLGSDILKGGGSAKECAVEVVRYLEDCHIFNAGYNLFCYFIFIFTYFLSKGSVCTENNDFELDAALMTGEGAIGSVIGVKRVKNPILLCKAISEDSSKPCIPLIFLFPFLLFSFPFTSSTRELLCMLMKGLKK